MFFHSKIKLHSETAADALEDSLSPLLKLVKMHNFVRQTLQSKIITKQILCYREYVFGQDNLQRLFRGYAEVELQPGHVDAE